MNDVAAACGVSKATLYHYVRDKHDLLAQITAGHVARLRGPVADVQAQRRRPSAPARAHPPLHAGLRRRATRAPRAHRGREVPGRRRTRGACCAAQRRVVAAFAAGRGGAAPRPAARRSCTRRWRMLLFGMINWTFTWLKAGGALTHETLAPVVEQLFFGGSAARCRQAPQRLEQAALRRQRPAFGGLLGRVQQRAHAGQADPASAARCQQHLDAGLAQAQHELLPAAVHAFVRPRRPPAQPAHGHRGRHRLPAAAAPARRRRG